MEYNSAIIKHELLIHTNLDVFTIIIVKKANKKHIGYTSIYKISENAH